MPAPALIMVAPNGARRIKDDHPAIPLTPQEIGCTAAECREAGADAIHLHVRDGDGAHILDTDLYRQAIAEIRSQAGPDIVNQVTTEAVGRYQPDQQMALIRDLRPEAFSVAVREILPEGGAEAPAADFLAWCHDQSIAAQYILYDPADLQRFAAFAQRGVIPGDRLSVLFVLGRYAVNQESDPNDLRPFLTTLEDLEVAERTDWMVCAFGRGETASATAAVALGGHTRVGFENSLWRPDGALRPSNADAVGQIRAAADILARSRPDRQTALRLLGGR